MPDPEKTEKEEVDPPKKGEGEPGKAGKTVKNGRLTEDDAAELAELRIKALENEKTIKAREIRIAELENENRTLKSGPKPDDTKKKSWLSGGWTPVIN